MSDVAIFSETDFVGPPLRGRQYTTTTFVQLSDADANGLARLDGIVRFLQYAATEDWESSGISIDIAWLARRTSVRAVGRWPRLYETLTLTTWCAGTGAAWAERRTNISADGELLLEGSSLWVPVNAEGFPQRIAPAFYDVYGEAMAGRKVSGRVPSSRPPSDAQRMGWPIRRADLDINGHVNNAAAWQAMSEVLDVPVAQVEVVHHGPLVAGDNVEVAWSANGVWLLVGDDVRVATHFAA